MRRFTAWLNMLATFAILLIYYTGLNTLTNQSISYDINIYLTFMLSAVVLSSTVNSMLYINTLHKDVDELKKNDDKIIEKIVIETEK
jgi:hypothetical protein